LFPDIFLILDAGEFDIRLPQVGTEFISDLFKMFKIEWMPQSSSPGKKIISKKFFLDRVM